MTGTLVVAEVFGPTVQGEGASMGRRCGFIRLGGCNLHCSWCDTPYTWDASRFNLRTEMDRRSVGDIVDKVRAMDVDLVVLTGGEPLLQQRYDGFLELVQGFQSLGIRMEIETNGTQRPAPYLTLNPWVTFNVSPKLAHGGDIYADRVNDDALTDFNVLTEARFKFVTRHVTEAEMWEDFDQIEVFVNVYKIDRSKVWVMPEGTSQAVVLAGTVALAEPTIRRGYNLTTRLHTLVWGDERKR